MTPQSVSISSPTSGAAIHYTTDGSTPTSSSTLYSGPISISVTKTIKAIAVLSGYFDSTVSTALYTINTGGSSGTGVNLGSGFTSGSMVLNGSAALNGTKLRLTNGALTQAAAAWFNAPQNIQNFSTNFSFQITPGTNPIADGLTFAIQGNNTAAIGPTGGGLGFGPDSLSAPAPVPNLMNKSVAIKFDLYDNSGEGLNSTGIYTNGVCPSIAVCRLDRKRHRFAQRTCFQCTDQLRRHKPHDDHHRSHCKCRVHAHVARQYSIGHRRNTGYVGFTGGTGGLAAIQDILNWTFTSSAGAPVGTRQRHR